MPVYQFAVRRDDEQDPDVRWTHLPDQETARRFADLLMKEFEEFVSNGRYANASQAFLEVRDDTGGILFSIPFRIT
jgi:hypothetical protein